MSAYDGITLSVRSRREVVSEVMRQYRASAGRKIRDNCRDHGTELRELKTEGSLTVLQCSTTTTTHDHDDDQRDLDDDRPCTVWRSCIAGEPYEGGIHTSPSPRRQSFEKAPVAVITWTLGSTYRR